MQHKDLLEMEENAQVINLKLISVKTEISLIHLARILHNATCLSARHGGAHGGI